MKKNTKGFTLLEVLVVIALLSIISISVSKIFSITYSDFFKQIKKNEYKYKLYNFIDKIKADMKDNLKILNISLDTIEIWKKDINENLICDKSEIIIYKIQKNIISINNKKIIIIKKAMFYLDKKYPKTKHVIIKIIDKYNSTFYTSISLKKENEYEF